RCHYLDATNTTTPPPQHHRHLHPVIITTAPIISPSSPLPSPLCHPHCRRHLLTITTIKTALAGCVGFSVNTARGAFGFSQPPPTAAMAPSSSSSPLS
ncbi:hypothetical protein Tco_0259440, partial [Tanacetum coccineum]